MNDPLPDPNDDPGVYEKGGKTYISLPSTEEAELIVHRTRKRLAELPALPKTTNPIAVVIAYELFGLAIEDIAIAMSLTIPQINGIKQHEAYHALKEQIITNIQDVGKEEVVELFKTHRMKAGRKIIDVMEHGRPNVALTAATKVLEASGVKMSPEHRPSNPMDKGLTIVFLEGAKSKEVPELVIEHDG